MRKILKITLLFVTLVILIPEKLNATGYFFYVQLKDKNGTSYSVSKPLEYLSQRAVDRRKYYNISLDSTDLPVNRSYVTQIESFGIHVHCTTKWLNGVTVLVKDTSIIQQVRKLSFVRFAQYTGQTSLNLLGLPSQKAPAESNFDYGAATTQINQLNGGVLHTNGFRGENIHIAVIDAGFKGVDANTAFDSLRLENRLLGTRDFVNPASNIYAEDTHGAHVLSTMAANVPGTFLGTAPKASYWLIRTESAIGEYPCEPDFWISGIEMADSTGVDLATTSLGYTTFDDASMNYTYNDLDGKTIRASVAANLACKKGMVLLNSAGNDGNKVWKYIGVPADAEKVITVGSVDKNGYPSAFSSFGPSADSRIKPELCAMGTSSSVVSPSGSTAVGSGTSFATPILAGLIACYLQAVREKTPAFNLDDLRENLFKNANKYYFPNNQMGYGMPNFQTAYEELKNIKQINFANAKAVKVLIKSENQILRVRLNKDDNTASGTVRLFSLTGQKIVEQPLTSADIRLDISWLENGIYILQIDKN